MNAMQQLIFVRYDLAPKMRFYKSVLLKMGKFGPNKGAIMTPFTIDGNAFLMVNVHLESKSAKERQKQLTRI